MSQSRDWESELKRPQLSSIDKNLLSQIAVVILSDDPIGEDADNIIITKSDEVFGFGTNKNGRLGLGNATKVDTPMKIPELSAKRVKNVVFGIQSMAALTESGDVYTSGYETYGVLGNGRNSGQYIKPEKISINNEIIIDIKCCFKRTILLTQTNQVYWFGCDHQNTYIINTPTLLNNFNNEKVIEISTGWDHVLALTKTGKTYSWGYNGWGQLGLGHSTNSQIPEQIQLSTEFVKQISCANDHSLVLTSNGVIYSFGRNSFGQLGTGNTSTETLPKCVTSVFEKFTEVFAFHFISMALTENQSIYVWGQTNQPVCVFFPLKTDLNSFQKAIDFYSKVIITFKPLILSDISIKRPLNRVIETTTKMFNKPKNSDLKFKLKPKGSEEFNYIYGHKSFIEENSEHFKIMFANERLEIQSTEIEITDYSYEAYYQFIKSLYTDCIETEDIEILIEMLSITEGYLDEDMKLKCVEKIKPLTTVLNVCTVYSCALKYRSKELENYCFEIMSNNMKSIVKSEDYDRMDSSDAKHFMTKYFE